MSIAELTERVKNRPKRTHTERLRLLVDAKILTESGEVERFFDVSAKTVIISAEKTTLRSKCIGNVFRFKKPSES